MDEDKHLMDDEDEDEERKRDGFRNLRDQRKAKAKTPRHNNANLKKDIAWLMNK